MNAGGSLQIKALVKDGAGVVVSNAVVSFATDIAIAALNPATATALTDATGTATLNLYGVAAGAATVTATVTIGASTVTGTAAYAVNAVTLSPLSFGVAPLPANSSTTVSVTVSSGGVAVTSPVSVVFSSICATAGTASISSPVTTVAGIATATYTDNGCGTTDTIIATTGGVSQAGTLAITPPSTGSVSLSLIDTSTGLAATSMNAGGSLQIKALVKDGAGVVVSNAVVSFATDIAIAALNPATATALTDATGTATLNLYGVAAGAATVTATVTIGAATVTGTAAYLVRAVTLSGLTFGVAPLPANSSTTVSVTVSSGGVVVTSPVAVLFSSTCAIAGTATISSPVTTLAGIATATYTDNGCGAGDTITASVGGVSQASSIAIIGGTATLTLTDPTTGLPVSNVTIGSPINANAVVTDSAGVAVAGAVVTFAANTAIGSIIPASATALTDATGLATVQLDGVAAGADTLMASTQLGTATVTSSIAYSVGAAIFTMPNPITFLVNPLSAYGSTSVNVDVFSGGVLVTSPIPVTFSSVCATAGKATISSPVATNGGTATATYTDNGCGAADTITASVGGASLAGLLNVTPPTAGSIQFVSAVPTQIALKGTGGLGHQETSIVIFKVLDSVGNPVPAQLVSFALSTTVGGITLSQVSGTTDALGQVSVSVQSGTISTPVRIVATAGALQTLSDALTITTGIPDQDSFSLSASTLNIEGWSVDGISTVLTARVSDHFNNPVPDGTAVNFTAEGGQIIGTCSTMSGACTSTLFSSNPRPQPLVGLKGRVTVLAYAVGNESFIDLNGNGLADNAAEMFDVSNNPTDLNEAFVDYDESTLASPIAAQVPNGLEPFIDFNVDGLFTLVDAQYSGVLCNPAAGVFCAASPNVHVRNSIVIVFSSSTPSVAVSVATVDLGGNNVVQKCSVVPAPVVFQITDTHGNAMPAGTTISFATNNGTITSGSSFIVPNTAANVLSSPLLFNYSISLKSDATYAAPVVPAVVGTCTDLITGGGLSVTVTTPLGTASTVSIPVTN